ncbi:MAG: DUF72 domain-containing protein [Acidobacteria bacterium]|nr:DUF72 domain-containing protein [Acidobacteriota bacterium]MBS1867463.1 DUF72 domain-containing protein [Acidobacteriota bacterium]
MQDILLGTSSFTAKGWEGVFYPAGMKSQDFLSFYAKQFQTVEIDSTFYGTPKPSTVENWKQRTPQDFIFALKIPQIITHEKVLVGCESEFDEFLETMSLLGEKLGPMLFQFPKFDKWMLNKPEELIARLDSFLGRVTNQSLRFVVEIRNRNWLIAPLLDFLRNRNVALALTDTTFVPRPWETKEPLNLITADFAYVRWLGDRKGIEQVTTNWNKPIIDREPELRRWVDFLNQMVLNKDLRKVFAFANNHYAGHAPATLRLFEKLWAIRK